MKIITLLNEKGGVGKTTLSVHLAAGLAIKGHRVLLVDADAQGHATVMFGLAKEPGLHDLLVRNTPFQRALRVVSPEVYEIPGEPVRGRLFVLPSNVETRNIATNIHNPLIVRDKVMQLESVVDTVIFDTSPTPSLLHGAIALATDGILIPTLCEILAFDGVRESLLHRDSFITKKQSLGLGTVELLGIIPTRFKPQTLEHSEMLEELKGAFGAVVWEPIHDRIIWSEAARAYKPAFSYAPGTQAARDAWALVNRAEEVIANVTS